MSDKGIFRQHYQTDDLAIADLTKVGLVLRYRVEGTDTGFEGEEGTFTICSFRLVTALAMIGETINRPGTEARPPLTPSGSTPTPVRGHSR